MTETQPQPITPELERGDDTKALDRTVTIGAELYKKAHYSGDKDTNLAALLKS